MAAATTTSTKSTSIWDVLFPGAKYVGQDVTALANLLSPPKAAAATTAPSSTTPTYYYGGQSVGGQSVPGGGIKTNTTPSTTPQPTTAKTTTSQPSGMSTSQLLAGIEAPQTGYQEAYQAEEAMIPLIQQRYKALLDELKQTTATSTAAETQSAESQIGATRARAGAAGTFYGGQELGSEGIIRKQAADTIAQINATEATQEEKQIAQEAIEEGQVTTDLANLGVSESAATRQAYSTALDFILKSQQYSTELAKTGGGAIGDQLNTDLQNGMGLQDAVAKYGAYVSPQTIYQRANSINPTSVGKLSNADLTKLGISGVAPQNWKLTVVPGLGNITRQQYLVSDTGAVVSVGSNQTLIDPETGETVSVEAGSAAWDVATRGGWVLK